MTNFEALLLSMTATQYVTLASAGFGIVGTIFLFFGTFGLQPFEGAPFNSPELQEYNLRVKVKNKGREVNQYIGLALLLLSFSFQVIAVFLPSSG